MADIIIQKYCPKCKIIKPISEFSKNRNRPDKKQYWCKICMKIIEKVYRQTEKGKEAFRRGSHKYQQTEKGKIVVKRADHKRRKTQRRKESNRKYRLNNPEKQNARQAITVAVRTGKLPKSKTLKCHYCPKQAQQYHHHLGYAPEHRLDVVPACGLCDVKQHKLNHII